MIQTAFQIGAFQFNAFQEGVALGSGGWRRTLLLRDIRRKRRYVEPVSPTIEEVEEVIAQARERAVLNFRVTPIVTDLGPLAEAMTRRQERMELEEFKALLEQLATIEEYV